MKQFKSGFSLAAISAIIFMASCSKENIIPGGTLGDPKDPSNGTVSTTQYSPGLGPILPQRQESGNSGTNLSRTHGTKVALNTTDESKTK